MPRKKRETLQQIAVLPFRRCDGRGDDAIEILLITSRETGRWVIPKGNIDSGQTPHGAAVTEALEEAGVRGRTEDRVIGHYRYHKYRTREHWDLAEVAVFVMEVTQELDDWKERAERKRKWFSRAKAADRVGEKQLKTLIRTFCERS
jgi:8-oxo-dGTP pyrophosphatase MutT (NUDIX family)